MSAAGAMRRRVVVVFESSPASETALAAAAALATRLPAHLAGLFIEDVNLMRMAALPFAHELGRVSAMLRPIQARDIEREFRLQAERARRALEAAAAGLQVDWSFEAVRGTGLKAVFELTRELDLVVVAPGGQVAERPTAARPLAILFDGSEAAWQAMETGQMLAEASGAALVVLVPAADRSAFDAARSELVAWLAGRRVSGRCVWLRERSAAQVCRVVREHHAGLLLWHDSASPRDAQLYARLVAGLPCPLVLVT